MTTYKILHEVYTGPLIGGILIGGLFVSVGLSLKEKLPAAQLLAHYSERNEALL